MAHGQGSAIRLLLGDYGTTELACSIQQELQAGRPVSMACAMAAVAFAASTAPAQLNGWILDGLPVTVAQVRSGSRPNQLDRSQNSPICPNFIEIPISFKRCEVDLLEMPDVLRAVKSRWFPGCWA